MNEKELRLATEEVVNEIKNFTNGQKKYYPEYKFNIERKKVYYFLNVTGLHMSGSATGMIPHIKKAIKEHSR